MAYNRYGCMADNVAGGSSSTYYADYFYQDIDTEYLLVGGSTGRGTNAGAFFFLSERYVCVYELEFCRCALLQTTCSERVNCRRQEGKRLRVPLIINIQY